MIFIAPGRSAVTAQDLQLRPDIDVIGKTVTDPLPVVSPSRNRPDMDGPFHEGKDRGRRTAQKEIGLLGRVSDEHGKITFPDCLLRFPSQRPAVDDRGKSASDLPHGPHLVGEELVGPLHSLHGQILQFLRFFHSRETQIAPGIPPAGLPRFSSSAPLCIFLQSTSRWPEVPAFPRSKA